MTFKMTEEQANAYALRMSNDDSWDKNYTPILDKARLVKEFDSQKIIIPMVVLIERDCVTDDDEHKYEDRPDALTDDCLAEDDQGIITMKYDLALEYPIPQDLLNESDCFHIAKNIDHEVRNILLPTMYDEEITLSNDATAHLLNCINKDYMVIDTFDQHQDLIFKISQMSEKLETA